MSKSFSFKISLKQLDTSRSVVLNDEYSAVVNFVPVFRTVSGVTFKCNSAQEALVKFEVYVKTANCINNIDMVNNQCKVLNTEIAYEIFFHTGEIINTRNELIFIVSVHRYTTPLPIERNLCLQQTTTTSPVDKTCTVESFQGLSKAMKTLLQGDQGDVILCVKTKEIRAHKLVLSARSAVLAKMFETNMKEKLEDSVRIEDISPEIMKEFLTFIYTGIVTIRHMSMARDLFMVAHKYDVADLQGVCSNYLKDVTLHSVLETLSLADLCEDEPLKKSALDFVKKNYNLVKTLPSWENFKSKNQKLTIELLSYIIDAKH